MKDRLIPPSERPEIRKEQEDARVRAAHERAESLKSVVRRIGETPDGLEFFRWLREECGGNQSILGAIQGQIDEKATMYQAMRLNLWIKVRRMLSFNILKEVEYEPDQIS
jgi:hypothetical protein